MHVVNNKHLFTKNLAVHNHDTRSANNFHLNITNLTKYQKQLIMQELTFWSSSNSHKQCSELNISF